MSKLFIIGNGFDLSHRIKSSYSHFRKFLVKKCGGHISYMPETYINQDGDVIADETTSAGLLIELIDNIAKGENWADLESYLADFDYQEYFEDYDLSDAINSDDDDEMFRVAHNREDISSDLRYCVRNIKSLFGEWIYEVDIDVLEQKRYKELFSNDSLFLSFNYTKTLESVYQIDNSSICHIHGTINQNIYFGHGCDSNPYASDDFELLGIDFELSQLFDELRKNVYECYKNNICFFNRIKHSNITDIYSIGFSFSEVDIFYIKIICDLLQTDKITWHLTEYDKQNGKNSKFESQLKENGFIGSFGNLVPEE